MANSVKLWRCAGCGKILREQPVEYARERHDELVRTTRRGDVEFVREATWGAFLASLRRCRCGSRKQLQPVQPQRLRGQLPLQLDAVVFA